MLCAAWACGPDLRNRGTACCHSAWSACSDEVPCDGTAAPAAMSTSERHRCANSALFRDTLRSSPRVQLSTTNHLPEYAPGTPITDVLVDIVARETSMLTGGFSVPAIVALAHRLPTLSAASPRFETLTHFLFEPPHPTRPTPRSVERPLRVYCRVSIPRTNIK